MSVLVHEEFAREAAMTVSAWATAVDNVLRGAAQGDNVHYSVWREGDNQSSSSCIPVMEVPHLPVLCVIYRSTKLKK